MAIYKVTGLNKTYQNDRKAVRAIENCNFVINEGECVAISGGRASGKSTLLRILGGLERATSGTVYIGEKNISNFDDDELAIMRRNEIGYLFHNDSLLPELSVHENIIMPSILAHRKYNKPFYRELIECFGIDEFLSCYPRQLTMKQLQNVTYARALINDPNIILVDEPAGGFSGRMDEAILEYLLNKVYCQHRTLVIVSNDSEMKVFANHNIRLKDGKIIEDKINCLQRKS